MPLTVTCRWFARDTPPEVQVNPKLRDARIREHGRRPINESIRIARQVLAGLEAAHAAGILHRDIKPSNILLDAVTGEAKITDFGLARHEQDAAVTVSANVVGTPGFIAPEILGEPSARVDERADLFSVGCVLYTMCAGEPPFDGHSIFDTLQRVANVEPPDLQHVRPATPRWLAMLVRRLMSKTADDRPNSAAETEAMLIRAKALSNIRPRSVWRRKTSWPWIAGVLALGHCLCRWCVGRLGQSRLVSRSICRRVAGGVRA